jgi:hypothetical protein
MIRCERIADFAYWPLARLHAGASGARGGLRLFSGEWMIRVFETIAALPASRKLTKPTTSSTAAFELFRLRYGITWRFIT